MHQKKIKNISFIIPIFNEEPRLDYLFKRIISFIKKYKNITTEFILVNDGSQDNSYEKIKKFINSVRSSKKINIFLITYKINKGKGYALKKGALISKHDWLLTLDADLSTDFDQIIEWDNKYDIKKTNVYWGSRALDASRVKSIMIRKFLGFILKLILSIFYNFEIKDTQCGFKLYHKNIAKKLFKKLDTFDFSHDIKLLILLSNFNVKVQELPISWTHRYKGKVNLLKDGFIILYKIIIFKYKK